jgi:hypothetical protein
MKLNLVLHAALLTKKIASTKFIIYQNVPGVFASVDYVKYHY